MIDHPRNPGLIYTPGKYINAVDEQDKMQVSKWGNSLAVRLPAAVVEALNLREGDHIEIQVEGAQTMAVRKSPSNQELLARLRKFRGRLPEGFHFDRLEAHERQ